ncbi:hypothetical protein TREMEDRAFT_61009 [Tremella mesenterica DSM 1558]|uniref:uncharacterized protein n=1 Tax=Tremella mesenterica (strain ATCC 24925 / CBS 8224 / DSM 1558 / NBRC 9311 / NRRL Y-6157 / RJB 2259-6 / UBC 559-6) TaxID=578456 RepID=UPI0003F49D50|nr:uncharacterized protein TREMEDRAFT_61009 [Tremella mesenterica DSM 1558]EIW70505.1 hypothetical protein TREMEDRAFT_61009 [Tremella mesenterica DSM 1558]
MSSTNTGENHSVVLPVRNYISSIAFLSECAAQCQEDLAQGEQVYQHLLTLPSLVRSIRSRTYANFAQALDNLKDTIDEVNIWCEEETDMCIELCEREGNTFLTPPISTNFQRELTIRTGTLRQQNRNYRRCQRQTLDEAEATVDALIEIVETENLEEGEIREENDVTEPVLEQTTRSDSQAGRRQHRRRG